MCLGIPGRIVELDEGNDQIARADVLGVMRDVNVGLMSDEAPRVGDWVLIHLGFAMAVIDEGQAATALEGLRLMGRGGGADGPEAVAEPTR
ncbi:HypC/HybG/HupF family hydrogenase formation chaperone [soil metagenome]